MFSPFRSSLLSTSRLYRTMSTTSAPELKPFTLSMIQLGQIGADKSANLAHAKDMIARAAKGEGSGAEGKPDLIVLPVRNCTIQVERMLYSIDVRNASTLPMARSTSLNTPKRSDSPAPGTTCPRRRARVYVCSVRLPRQLVCGCSEVCCMESRRARLTDAVCG